MVLAVVLVEVHENVNHPTLVPKCYYIDINS